jgi:hypothetical protein
MQSARVAGAAAKHPRACDIAHDVGVSRTVSRTQHS